MVCGSVAYSKAGKISTSEPSVSSLPLFLKAGPQGTAGPKDMLPTQLEAAPDALNTADQPLLELLLDTRHLPVGSLLGPLEDDLGVLGAREEVDDVDDAILVNVAGLQDV